ncbi:MAG TPA: amidohydrolase family protein, partial [Candidatus Binatia bacterium]|nr:amidohydrolase family protein [Candidatus Binatia bacterium]
PSEVTATPFEQIERELAVARELSALRVSCHVSMGRWDHGARVVGRLAAADALDEDLLFVHGSTLTRDELAAIADSGASISCTPETELQMAMGRPVFARAQAAGARPSLGIDIVSNFSGDMFAQMRLLLQSERGFDNELRTDAPRALGLKARDVLELATIAGARAAGLDGVTGSITPGKQADLVLTRTDSPHMAGVCDPVAALVLYAAASDVDTVLVGGDVLKRGGTLVGYQGPLDWPGISQRLGASGERIRRRASMLPRDEIAPLLASVMFAPER